MRTISYSEALEIPVGSKLVGQFEEITRYPKGFGWTKFGEPWELQPGLGEYSYQLIPLTPEECDQLPIGTVVDSFNCKVTRVKGGWKRDDITWLEPAKDVLATENYIISNTDISNHVAWVKKHFKPESPAYKLAEYIDENH